MDPLLNAALDYLIFDGFFGPITLEEWEYTDGRELPLNPREYVFSRRDELDPSEIRSLREIYGAV